MPKYPLGMTTTTMFSIPKHYTTMKAFGVRPDQITHFYFVKPQ